MTAALAIFALTRPIPAAAQPPPPTGPLTLEQVLELGEARSEALAAARASVSRAVGDQIRARSGLFPQLSASASYDRALASEFEGVFDDVENPFASPGEGGDEGGLDLPFGRENTWRLSLSFSQNLFSGGRIGAQRALADAGRSAAEIGVETARAQLLFDLTQAFYDAALSERMVAIAEATLEQSQATVRQVEAAFKAGVQPEFELLRARVARDNQTPALIRTRATRAIALVRLKQLLDLPAGSDLDLAVSLDDVASPPPAFAARVADVEAYARGADPIAALLTPAAALPDRAPIQDASTVVELRQASLDAARAERMPAVSLNSIYGRVGYPSGVLPELNRTNWNIGATVTVPILTGGRQRGSEMAARAELEQSRAQLQHVTELAAVDTRSAWAELLAARAAWEATAGTVQQALRAHQIAEVRYREGVSTQLELSDARLLLQQAEANRAQAARDLQVARARVALLPGLPLGTGSPARPQPQAAPVPVMPPPAVPAFGGPDMRNASVGGQGQRFGWTGGQP